MSNDRWMDVAGRLSPSAPTDLDDLLLGPKARQGGWLERNLDAGWITPARPIWAGQLGGLATIGVRVTEQLDNPARTAARLVAIAGEREVTPIIFSTLATCGLERFGFRVERLSGANARQQAACEAELMSFWDIAIVIDAAQIGDLG